MVKTVHTYVSQSLKDEFETFLRESYQLNNFGLYNIRKSDHLGIQFYNKDDATLFDEKCMDAKFLIARHSDPE